MFKILLLMILLLPGRMDISAQFSTTATASTSVIIINPVGTETEGNMISGSFQVRNDTAIVELNKTAVLVNGKSEPAANSVIPSFLVRGEQYSYTITVEFDPLIRNWNESMRVESFTIQPLKLKELEEEEETTRFSMKTRIHVGESQSPGHYSAEHPFLVTIHFN